MTEIYEKCKLKNRLFSALCQLRKETAMEEKDAVIAMEDGQRVRLPRPEKAYVGTLRGRTKGGDFIFVGIAEEGSEEIQVEVHPGQLSLVEGSDE